MKVAYVDSSALLAVLLDDKEGRGMKRRFARLDALFSSGLLEAEVRSALSREGVDSVAADSALRSLRWVLPDRPLTSEFVRVLSVGHLRGADLWHVACGLFLAPDPATLSFLTLDDRQAAVAAKLGFGVG